MKIAGLVVPVPIVSHKIFIRRYCLQTLWCTVNISVDQFFEYFGFNSQLQTFTNCRDVTVCRNMQTSNILNKGIYSKIKLEKGCGRKMNSFMMKIFFRLKILVHIVASNFLSCNVFILVLQRNVSIH